MGNDSKIIDLLLELVSLLNTLKSHVNTVISTNKVLQNANVVKDIKDEIERQANKVIIVTVSLTTLSFIIGFLIAYLIFK